MLEKAVFIKNFVIQRCTTPWQVVLRTGGRADLNLVMGIINTSPKDFVRFLLRPKGARTSRHGIRSLLTSESAAEDELIPDTAKLAADTVHLITGWEKPVYSDAVNHVWEIAQPLERAAYYFLIVSVIEDFAFDWYSGILTARESRCGIGVFKGGCFQSVFTPLPVAKMYIFDIIPPGSGCHINNHDLIIEAGLWFIVIEYQYDTRLGDGWESIAHFEVRVGDAETEVCGPRQVHHLEQNALSDIFVYSNVISAPERISVWSGLEPVVHIAAQAVLSCEFKSFRLS